MGLGSLALAALTFRSQLGQFLFLLLQEVVELVEHLGTLEGVFRQGVGSTSPDHDGLQWVTFGTGAPCASIT